MYQGKDIFKVRSYDDSGKPRYEFIRDIGEGGMGRVSLLFDNDLNREVVIKSVRSNLKDSSAVIELFVQEAKVIGQLEHPNIIPIYDFGVLEDGHVFYTMKYIKGQTLKQVIKALSRGHESVHLLYNWNRRVNIIQQICEALEFAHAKGVIHRDLKPDNIMIGEFGEVLVMDWGLAKIFESEQGGGHNSIDIGSSSFASKENSISGTPLYMSPEQVSNPEKVSKKSDLYSLGSIMYEFLSLSRAHNGDNIQQVLMSVVNDFPKPLTKIKANGQGVVPIELEYVINDLMKKEPERRHDSAKHLKDDLQKFIDGMCPVRCPHTALKRSVMSFGRLVDEYPKVIILSLFALTVSLVSFLLIP